MCVCVCVCVSTCGFVLKCSGSISSLIESETCNAVYRPKVLPLSPPQVPEEFASYHSNWQRKYDPTAISKQRLSYSMDFARKKKVTDLMMHELAIRGKREGGCLKLSHGENYADESECVR